MRPKGRRYRGISRCDSNPSYEGSLLKRSILPSAANRNEGPTARHRGPASNNSCNQPSSRPRAPPHIFDVDPTSDTWIRLPLTATSPVNPLQLAPHDIRRPSSVTYTAPSRRKGGDAVASPALTATNLPDGQLCPPLTSLLALVATVVLETSTLPPQDEAPKAHAHATQRLTKPQRCESPLILAISQFNP